MKLNNKGFSLVELMVVVAIIGILASIAIPSVNKYMAKARQTEAKTNLSSLYTAEKAFAAEYNAYASNFKIVGIQPEGNLRYDFGFSADDGLTLASYGYSNTTLDADTGHYKASLVCKAAGAATAEPCTMLTGSTTTAVSASATVSSDTAFVGEAVGKISTNGANADIWRIDQNKIITNAQDGIN